ncbi:hypothetical protein RJ641_006054 [Dillenia turbinata]|uniref:Protein ECERIFERUM 26-like n=1 Tax=Dillenia turbinata TaxID=194707 RepID=A0AAN8VGZ5_9MAGN
MADISFICKRTAVSTKAVQPGKFHQLSVFDRAMESNHIRMVYYYRSQIDREPGEMTKILRERFAEMLTSYPIVTGRLHRNEKGHWMIKCNDAGVRMVEARAKGSVEEWLENVDSEKELKLAHWEEMFHRPYFWSTFYVQLTEFEEGGLAVGLSCTHLLADPISATVFVKAWADISLTGKMVKPPLFHPLPPRRPSNGDQNHNHHTQAVNFHKSSTNDSTTPNPVQHSTITLEFSDRMVRVCIAMAQSISSAPNEPSPSPFEALAGLFWVCVSRVKGKKNGLIDMSICSDMRKVLNLDQGFFGNCMVYSKVNGEGLRQVTLSKAAMAIRNVLEKIDIEAINDLIESLERKDDQTLSQINSHDLICAKLDHMDPYMAIFERGMELMRVSYYIKPVSENGQVLILPAPKGGDGPFSRMVMVTLAKDEVSKLCEDCHILHFSPTIRMGAKK